jgi:Uma2 family endonuclease
MSILSIPNSVILSPLPLLLRKKIWTVEEFHQLRRMPWYETRRMILVHGEIIDVPNPNPPHDIGIGLTEDVLRDVFGTACWVRVRMALVLGQTTDPVPDLAVVSGKPRDYQQHPTSALLVVEVSDSTLNYDTGEKANLYAASGILDYWVLDLNHRQLIVHRDPIINTMQPFSYRYATIITIDETTNIAPIAQPNTLVSVKDLLP